MTVCFSADFPSTVPTALLEEMFDQYPDSPFFIKDAGLRYISVNNAMVDFLGAHSKSDLIGKRVSAFFPDGLYQKYEDLDRRVLDTGQPVTFKLDQSITPDRPLIWLLFHRFPFRDEHGNITGIIAMSRQLEQPGSNHTTYIRLVRVADHINENSDLPLDLASLAALANISPSQLNRDFKKVIGMTPRQFQLKARFRRAVALLASDQSIANIAHTCGYADQSAFSRRFKDIKGCTPLQYRRRLRGEIQQVFPKILN